MTKYIKNLTRFNNKSGAALLSVILVITILSVIGAAIIGLTLNNTRQAIYLKNYEKSYYESEAGIKQGNESVKRAAVIELKKLKDSGATIIDNGYLSRVITTAMSLLPESAKTKLSMSIVNNQLRVDSTGGDIGLTRQTRMFLTLNSTSVQNPITPSVNNSLIIGGNITVPKNTASTVFITLSPGGVVAGDIADDKVKIDESTISDELPTGFTWWQNMQPGLINRFVSRADGYYSDTNNVIEIKASGVSYPDKTVTISKNNATSFQIAGRTITRNLKNTVVLVDGNVKFALNTISTDGATSNMMVFATGDVYIEIDVKKNSQTFDPIFIYAGGKVTLKDDGDRQTHQTTIYANEFHYITPIKGETNTTFSGQLMIKNNFVFESVNGAVKLIANYNNGFVSAFFNKLNDLSYQDVIVGETTNGTGGYSLPTGNIFTESKIFEVSN